MALDPNRWTLKTQEAFNAAITRATSDANPEVTPDHLVVALLGQSEGVVLPILEKVGASPASLRNRAEDALAKLPKAYGGGEPRLSRALSNIVELADAQRAELHDEYLSTEHLLLALSGQLDLDREQLLLALQSVRGSHRVTSQNPEDQYQALEKYGRDLTEAARQGKLDPVIGRDEEIRRT
ncbi:MAG: type VI secretion system ATPase TssH, partial [Acidimicrobiales bacterium]|nr:type VI secretion system ATPase TssH [Acidimicrobiales bacterium]